jgi:hypothetical protein
MASSQVERYRHDVERWTVGQLRAALDGPPNDMVLRAEVALARVPVILTLGATISSWLPT